MSTYWKKDTLNFRLAHDETEIDIEEVKYLNKTRKTRIFFILV
jgi:hypothetical protein